MELTRQTRTNAVISYFFLGPLFLLAKNNPNFAEPFVRAHAKAASKAVLLYLAIFFVHLAYLSEYLNFSLPLVPIQASRVVSATILVLLFGTLLRGVIRANAGKMPKGTFDLPGLDSLQTESVEIGTLSEHDRTMALLGFVPLFGIVLAARKPTPANSLGCRAGSFAFALYALVSVNGGDALLMVATFAYAVFFVTVGVTIFTAGQIPFEKALANIPSLERLWTGVRTLPEFLFATVKAVFGKSEELSFPRTYATVALRDRTFERVMDQAFSESTFPISPKLVSVPVLNLLFLPRLFSASPYRFAIAAGQGVAMTVIYALLVWQYGFSNGYQILLLPAVALLLGNVEPRPFYRIPVLYEIYSLVGILTFGLANRARRVKDVANKEVSVSFKV